MLNSVYSQVEQDQLERKEALTEHLADVRFNINVL